MFERRINKHKLADTHLPAHVRAVTFDGPEHHSTLCLQPCFRHCCDGSMWLLHSASVGTRARHAPRANLPCHCGAYRFRVVVRADCASVLLLLRRSSTLVLLRSEGAGRQ